MLSKLGFPIRCISSQRSCAAAAAGNPPCRFDTFLSIIIRSISDICEALFLLSSIPFRSQGTRNDKIILPLYCDDRDSPDSSMRALFAGCTGHFGLAKKRSLIGRATSKAKFKISLNMLRSEGNNPVRTYVLAKNTCSPSCICSGVKTSPKDRRSVLAPPIWPTPLPHRDSIVVRVLPRIRIPPKLRWQFHQRLHGYSN